MIFILIYDHGNLSRKGLEVDLRTKNSLTALRSRWSEIKPFSFALASQADFEKIFNIVQTHSQYT